MQQLSRLLSLSLYPSIPLSISLSIYIYVTLSICISSSIYIHIYIHMAPTQEHPAKYFSAHICPRPFWNPVKFQPYFKNSHHRQPQQILIHITVRPKTTASCRPGVGNAPAGPWIEPWSPSWTSIHGRPAGPWIELIQHTLTSIKSLSLTLAPIVKALAELPEPFQTT